MRLAQFLHLTGLVKRSCPNSECQSKRIIKSGFYHRTSDGRDIQRFLCKDCKKAFSAATGTDAYGQNKRRLNFLVFKLLSSNMSQNRIAKVLVTTRKTVVRKLVFLSKTCARKNEALLQNHAPSTDIQFDELETIEHTKCKPLSVALAVDVNSRTILGFEVSSMPANGHLARIAQAKYGKRPDHRRRGLRRLLENVKPRCAKKVSMLSDMCPRYLPIVRKVFATTPEILVHYSQTKGARGRSDGQGELKKLAFDPLFTLNHTCAMLRANINRLIRKTWCTTKKAERLGFHLNVYIYYHNRYLLNC